VAHDRVRRNVGCELTKAGLTETELAEVAKFKIREPYVRGLRQVTRTYHGTGRSGLRSNRVQHAVVAGQSGLLSMLITMRRPALNSRSACGERLEAAPPRC
jgi:hypothetical protein